VLFFFFFYLSAATLAFRGLSGADCSERFLWWLDFARAKRGDAGMLRVEVEPSGEDFWKLDPIIDLINRGAVGVIPTDTVYADQYFTCAFLSFVLKSHTPTATV
jgi:hypothetical protein